VQYTIHVKLGRIIFCLSDWRERQIANSLMREVLVPTNLTALHEHVILVVLNLRIFQMTLVSRSRVFPANLILPTSRIKCRQQVIYVISCLILLPHVILKFIPVSYHQVNLSYSTARELSTNIKLNKVSFVS